MMRIDDPVLLLLFLFAAMTLTLLAMPWVIWLAHRVGAVDHPDVRKVHSHAMPRMGGLAFLFGLFVLPLSMWSTFDIQVHPDLLGFLIGLAVVAATGMTDDIIGISPKWKFLGLILGSILFVLISDTAIRDLGNLFALGTVETGLLAVPITVLAMVGFVNALNLSDGLDGLAAGIALIAVFFLGFFSLKVGDPMCLALSAVLFGGMVGFLYFNSHPAQVFMGDTGSLVLGYVLAAISLLLIKAHGAGDAGAVSPVMMGVLLALPLSDTLYVMGQRIREGEKPFSPDKTHFHHRLMGLGFTHSGVVGTIYSLMVVYGIASIALMRFPAWLQLLALLALVIGTFGLLRLIEKSGLRIHFEEAAPATVAAPVRSWRWMPAVTGKSIPYVTWFIPLSLVFPALSINVGGAMRMVVIASIALAVLPYPWNKARDATWSNGIFYLLVFTPILCINWLGGEVVKDYLVYVAIFLAVWVGLKLYYARHARIFLSTGLEVLLILLSWAGPWLVVEFRLVDAAAQMSLYLTSLQSLVFLLATKVVLRRQASRNRQLLIALLVLNCLLFV